MAKSPISVHILLAAVTLLVTLGVVSLYSSPPERLQPLLTSLDDGLINPGAETGKDSLQAATPNQSRPAAAAKTKTAKRPPYAQTAEMSVIVGLGVILALVLPMAPYRWGLTGSLLLGAGFLAFNHFYLLPYKGWRLSSFYPLLCLVTVYLLVTLIRMAFERSGRKGIQQAFSQNPPGSAIEHIMNQPQDVSLEARRKELTILSMSLSGLSALSEELAPQELADFLSRYASEMGSVILDEAGTLDRIQGDAITAFWNAPLQQPDHAVRAVRTALECLGRISGLQDELGQTGKANISLRAGINTAGAVVGEMGQEQRGGYTVLGGAAKLARRLEEANRLFGSSILMVQETWQQTGGRFEGRELGELKLPGCKMLVTVVEPLGLAGEVDMEPFEPFLQGLAKVRQGEMSAALRIFEELKKDPAARAYAVKLRKIAKDGGSWTGVWRPAYI